MFTSNNIEEIHSGMMINKTTATIYISSRRNSTAEAALFAAFKKEKEYSWQ